MQKNRLQEYGWLGWVALAVCLLVLSPMASATSAALVARSIVSQAIPAVSAGFEAELNEAVSWLGLVGVEVDDDLDENGIPDAWHAALLDLVLSDTNMPGYATVLSAWQNNMITAASHATAIDGTRLSDLLPPGFDTARFLAGLMTISEPNAVNLLQAAILGVYPNLTPDDDLLPDIGLGAYHGTAQSLLSAGSDLDGDGISNLDECLTSTTKAGFLSAATDGVPILLPPVPQIRITSAPAYGAGTSISGVVEHLSSPTAVLAAYFSRGHGKYVTKTLDDGFMQTVSSGVTWTYDFGSVLDAFSVRIDFVVVPVGTELRAYPNGTGAVPEIPEAILQTAVIRAPLTTSGAPTYYPLGVQVLGHGVVRALEGTIGYNPDQQDVQLQAAAAVGWEFDRWWGDVDLSDVYNAQITVRMDQARSLIAEFASLDGSTGTPGYTPGDPDEHPLVTHEFDADDADLSNGYWAVDDGFTQVDETLDPLDGGEARFLFVLDEPGIFLVRAMVNAPSESSNSLFLNFDANPVAPGMIWDIPVTSGIELRTARWRGSGTEGAPEFVPVYFNLSAGTHELIVRGREPGVHVTHVTIAQIYRDIDTWVDFSNESAEDGTRERPFNTLAEALASAPEQGLIGCAEGTSVETLTVTKAMRIDTIENGLVRIGVPAPPVALPPALMASATGTGDGNDGMRQILDGIIANLGADGGAGSLRDRASSDNIREGTVYEPVLPFTRVEGVQQARADSTLAFRLRDGRGVDPRSITAPVPGYGDDEVVLEWIPAAGDGSTDLWALVRPEPAWGRDEGFSITVNARTFMGEPLPAPLYSFATESEEAYRERTMTTKTPIFQPRLGVDYESSTLDSLTEAIDQLVLEPAEAEFVDGPLDGAVGKAYHLGPEIVFDPPQRVWLPVPHGVDPNGVGLYYYHGGDDAPGWYPAENVEGWLDSGAYMQLDLNGTTYLGFRVRHGGIAQLGIMTVDEAGMPITGGFTGVSTPRTTRPAGYALMGLSVAILCFVATPRRYRMAVRRASRRSWKQLGLALQNEDGPFFGRACWSGYYQDGNGVWRIERRVLADRRLRSEPTPAQKEMRKTIRRKMDWQILQWAEPALDAE